jgi:hypothetical protein
MSWSESNKDRCSEPRHPLFGRIINFGSCLFCDFVIAHLYLPTDPNYFQFTFFIINYYYQYIIITVTVIIVIE